MSKISILVPNKEFDVNSYNEFINIRKQLLTREDHFRAQVEGERLHILTLPIISPDNMYQDIRVIECVLPEIEWITPEASPDSDIAKKLYIWQGINPATYDTDVTLKWDSDIHKGHVVVGISQSDTNRYRSIKDRLSNLDLLKVPRA